MSFRSDNVSPVSPEILEAIILENQGCAPAYGGDVATRRLDDVFSELFDHDVAVFPTLTGTAANGLALAALAPRFSTVLCHADAHILMDEAGASEFFAGVRLVPVDGDDGKICVNRMEMVLSRRQSSGALPPAVVSFAQSSEAGTVYSTDEIAAICAFARRHRLAVHMDGARFANAVAATGRSPADLTWRAGVDVLTFGATKNGALAAEAIIFFDRRRAGELAAMRKRSGQTLSKMRFVSAQLIAGLADGLWIRNARRANDAAARLAGGLGQIEGVRIPMPADANQVFAELPEAILQGLGRAGIDCFRWGGPDSSLVRLVTSFDTTKEEVDFFVETARRCAMNPHAGGHKA